MFEHSRLTKNHGVKFPFFLAPMVGLSNVAFRELVRSYVPREVDVIMFTEMLSTRRLPTEKLECTNELRTSPGEEYFVPQLLGNEERFIKPSVEKLMSLKPWGFDINMGCPVSHTLKHNWGVRLMGDVKYAASIVEMTRRHSPVPLSVKLRASPGDEIKIDYLDEFTSALESSGADFLTIHARSRADGHRGEARWDVVAEIASRRGVPVIANGGIQTADDAIRLMTEFAVDGAMVARAASVRPWIFWQIAHKLGLTTSIPPQTLEEEGVEYPKAVLRYLDFLEKNFVDQEYMIERVRFFVVTGVRWFMFGHQFWKATMKAKTTAELRAAIIAYSETYTPKMVERIDF